MNNDSAPSRLEKVGFYILLATVILAPLSFWANSPISLDFVKVFVIAMGTIVSAVLFGFVAIKDRKLNLPPRSLAWTSLLTVISIVISSLLSFHFGKSFFGYGLEIGSASFIILLFVASLVTYTAVSRQKERAVVIYVGIAAAYIIVYLFQLLRLIFGVKFMSLGILNSLTSSLVGAWSNLGSFSMLIVIVSMLALLLLNLSSRMKIAYWVLLVISVIGTIASADIRVWQVTSLIFLGMAILFSIERWNSRRSLLEEKYPRLLKSFALVPIIAFVLSAILVWQASAIAGPINTKLSVNSGVTLSWQGTLDVTASAIQNYPLFGVGSNNFNRAFLAYKPASINSSDFWAMEFLTGFAMVPTFVASYGLIGSILWVLLFVFFAIQVVRVLKHLPEESDKRFMVISSLTMSIFLWLIAIVSLPSHTIFFFTFIMTGIFVAISASYGLLPQRAYTPVIGSKMYKFLPSIMAIVIFVLVIWGLVYLKKTIALAYYSSGQQQLNIDGNAENADKAFATALKFDSSDIYWQAKAEASLSATQKLASTITSTSPASSTQAVLTQINAVLNQGLVDARKAISYDQTNYRNYLSEARVSEQAANAQMPNGYENAVVAYANAIKRNPYNPAIYLSLASLEARQKKYDEALRDLGATLQVKNNYLDAVFLLSQVYAAKGDLANAIVAAKVAVQLNPQNALLNFQLGILDYSNKDYAGAATALEAATKIQADYANAKYFLGLSYARLEKNAEAITQFEDLAKSNPDNQEVALILANLRAGKSIFTDAKASVTTAPEKRSSLPIKEKR